MLFKKEMIKQIIAGKKTMTRRTVKKEETYCDWDKNKKRTYGIIQAVVRFRNKVRMEDARTTLKWQVGKKYAVCPGRGKPQVWYCVKCKAIGEGILSDKDKIIIANCDCEVELKPLFIELVSIKKENLLDISEEEAKQEGFIDTYSEDLDLSARQNFLDKFCEINKIGFREDGIPNQNPFVWVLEFRRGLK